jgi:hypothetical protein
MEYFTSPALEEHQQDKNNMPNEIPEAIATSHARYWHDVLTLPFERTQQW